MIPRNDPSRQTRIRRAPACRRRKLFGAAGVTAAVVGAAGAGALAGRASAARPTARRPAHPVPFRGERQAGIITEAQDRMHFATFDVTTDNRDDVVEMLQAVDRDGRADDAGRGGRSRTVPSA